MQFNTQNKNKTKRSYTFDKEIKIGQFLKNLSRIVYSENSAISLYRRKKKRMLTKKIKRKV